MNKRKCCNKKYKKVSSSMHVSFYQNDQYSNSIFITLPFKKVYNTNTKPKFRGQFSDKIGILC